MYYGPGKTHLQHEGVQGYLKLDYICVLMSVEGRDRREVVRRNQVLLENELVGGHVLTLTAVRDFKWRNYMIKLVFSKVFCSWI